MTCPPVTLDELGRIGVRMLAAIDMARSKGKPVAIVSDTVQGHITLDPWGRHEVGDWTPSGWVRAVVEP